MKVLVVDDEESFVDALVTRLTREGFSVETAFDGEQALQLFDQTQPDLVLLDVMLPGMSGLDVCRTLRKRSTVPVIMVSARSEEIDAVIGLEVGADDYIAKPYRVRELISRMRSVMRRVEFADMPDVPGDGLVADEIIVDPERHEVTVRGELVRMPLKEFELLSVLMENVNRVLPRERLIHLVWGYDYVGDTKTLDVHIKRLRAKVEVDAKNPKLIQTVRGLGYKLISP